MPDAFRPTDLAPGVLLVAPPVLEDVHFVRAVVLLCAHDDDGSFGLVLTDPLDARVGVRGDGGRLVDVPVRRGGPVSPDTLHVLHCRPDILPDAEPVADDIYWGGTLAGIGAHLTDADDNPGGGINRLADFRFFVGYAGWGAGQLADELAAGGWILHGATAAHVFSTPPAALWRTVLREMGEPYSHLAHFPADPRYN